MANGETRCVDHEARRLITELNAKHEACLRAREKAEMDIGQQLQANTREMKGLKSSVDQVHGGMKAWKILIPISMFIIAAISLAVSLSTKGG